MDGKAKEHVRRAPKPTLEEAMDECTNQTPLIKGQWVKKLKTKAWVTILEEWENKVDRS